MILGQIDNWRYLFFIGLLGVFSLLIMRRNIPQSPRWLILKNKLVQAQSVVKVIEHAAQNKQIFLQQMSNQHSPHLDNVQNELVSQRSQIDNSPIKNKQSNQQQQKSLRQIIQQIVLTIIDTIKKYKSRFVLAFFLMFTQAFFFNLVYYKFPAKLQNKYYLSQDQIATYMLPLSLSSFISTLIIGPLFDKIGRKQLLLITYGISGVMLVVSQYLRQLMWLQLIICFMFFFTSPAGSSANLIASQIFPTSSRTLVLFIMFMIGMVGGIMGVWIDTVWIGSILMVMAGIMGYKLCPESQNKSLEEIQKL